jgi:hypothetical protein
VSISGDVIGEIEAPARRPIGGRGSIDFGEPQAGIELADHVVLGGRNVVGNEGAHASLFRRLDRDIHRFEFELPAEHAAAHDPVLDLERIVIIRRRAQDHRADKTVVAQPIEKAELQGQGAGIIHDLRDLFTRIAAGGGVELVGLVEELDDPSLIDGSERP